MKRVRKVEQNYFEQIPIRSQVRPWTEDESGMVVIDVENKGLANRIAQRFFHKPKVSHISLDQYGTVVWKQMDGTHSVNDIIEMMKKEFPDEKDRMLDRVVTFLATLQAHEFILMR